MLAIVHISTRKRVPIISSYIVIFIPLRQYLPFDIHCCYMLMTNNVLFYRRDFAAFIFIDLSSN